MEHELTNRDYARLLKAVADETRLGLLRLLAAGDRSVTELAEALGLTIARVSHHLAILRAENLVIDRRQGRQIVYSFPSLAGLLVPEHRSVGWGDRSFEVASLLTGLLQSQHREAPPSADWLTVFAASDLRFAFTEIARAFERQSGVAVRLRFGSSGLLARQLADQSQADLFAAASPEAVERLGTERVLDPSSMRLFARGRLAIWHRAEFASPLERVHDLVRPEVRWVAIAHPDHAPNGAAAAMLLQRAGLWEELRPKLLLGNDSSQALQFADTDNGGAAIVSLALSPGAQGHYSLIPEAAHPPIEHALGVVADSPHAKEARAFASFISTTLGRSILKKYGMLPLQTA